MKKIEDNNTLVFIIDRLANKYQIKSAVKKVSGSYLYLNLFLYEEIRKLSNIKSHCLLTLLQVEQLLSYSV